jgi:hypothetical protein
VISYQPSAGTVGPIFIFSDEAEGFVRDYFENSGLCYFRSHRGEHDSAATAVRECSSAIPLKMALFAILVSHRSEASHNALGCQFQ